MNDLKNIYKILFMGPMGAGKTTAIKNLSETPILSTEARNSDTTSFNKETTTVGLDYGQIALSEDMLIHLYGSPGQERFSFMWDTLIEGSDGVVLLLNHEEPDALEKMESYVSYLKNKCPLMPIVIGVGRHSALRLDIGIENYENIIAKYEVVSPIFFVDVRQKEDSVFLLESLIYQVFY